MRRISTFLCFFPLLLLSCGLQSPELPSSDFRMDGTYAFSFSEDGSIDDQLDGSSIMFTESGVFQFTNPGFKDDEHGDFDIMEGGTYSFNQDSDSTGLLILEIDRQYPSMVASAYTFQGGFNRIRYQQRSEAGLGVEYLELQLTNSDYRRIWATFQVSIPLELVGDYAAVSSSSETWARRIEGAMLSFSGGTDFLLTNPVDVEIAHQETTVVVTESGTFSVTVDSLIFDVATQEPVNADSIYLLTAPQTITVVSLLKGQLIVVFSEEGKADTTYWSPPGTVEEIEPNDTREQATVLGNSGSYVAVGSLESGGYESDTETYSGDYDYFEVTPGSDGTLSIFLDWVDAADLDLILIDSSGETVEYSAVYGQVAPESISTGVAAGEALYILVVSFDNPASYSLTVTVP